MAEGHLYARTDFPEEPPRLRRHGRAVLAASDMKRIIIVGGGAAGLGAAYTLKKRGVDALLLEAENHVGGRLAADEVDGFLIDTGVDFFCYSYDAVFRICEELGVPLVRSIQKLGWYKDGRWHVTTAAPSIPGLVSNLRAFAHLGLLSWGAMKLIYKVIRQANYLTFASEQPHGRDRRRRDLRRVPGEDGRVRVPPCHP